MARLLHRRNREEKKAKCVFGVAAENSISMLMKSVGYSAIMVQMVIYHLTDMKSEGSKYEICTAKKEA